MLPTCRAGTQTGLTLFERKQHVDLKNSEEQLVGFAESQILHERSFDDRFLMVIVYIWNSQTDFFLDISWFRNGLLAWYFLLINFS